MVDGTGRLFMFELLVPVAFGSAEFVELPDEVFMGLGSLTTGLVVVFPFTAPTGSVVTGS